jgi:anti-sigma regulatory factor (Ser/Thr protein kinase)
MSINIVHDINESPSSAGPKLNWRILTEFTLDGVAGNEHQAMDRIAGAVQDLNLSPRRAERLKTAVGEATLNAIEYRSRHGSECTVLIRLLISKKTVAGYIPNDGSGSSKPKPGFPDSEAKIVGHQLPGGWGFFLVERRVDDTHLKGKEWHYVIEAFLYLEGEPSEG